MLKQNFLEGIIIGAIGGVLIGAIGGAVTGVLMAPQSGKKTRAALREQASDIGEAIGEKSQDIIDAGKRKVSKALQHGKAA